MVYTPSTEHPNGKRLLALDGGGVRGIMALEVLDDLMKRIQQRKGLAEVPRPADYFELAAGTSTGGIMGIMLFRLRMTAHDTIEQYKKISKDVFSPKVGGVDISKIFGDRLAGLINNGKALVQDSRFDDESMKKAIDDVVEKFGLDENDRTLKGKAPLQHTGSGRVFCCTTAQNRSETVLMRTYKDNNDYVSSTVNNVMKEHQDKVTISLAALATSAAPTFFPQVYFPDKSKSKNNLIFWDGGLLNNNPIDQLWYSRYELVDPKDPAPEISCVLSLGTGWIKPDSPSDSYIEVAGVVTSVMDFSTNTTAKGRDFSRHMSQMNKRGEFKNTKYVRLNPTLEGQDIGLADYKKVDELQNMAKRYMNDSKNQKWINEALDAICPP